MVDVLAHVLVGYAVAAALAHRGHLPGEYVPVAMVGSLLPDVAKVGMVVPPSRVEALLGFPFEWLVLHRLGGVVVLAGLGAVLFRAGRRRLVFAVLVGASLGHLLLDSLITRAGGYAPPYLYPLTWWQPPAAGLYLSSDLWPLAGTVVLAAVTWATTTGRLGAAWERVVGGDG